MLLFESVERYVTQTCSDRHIISRERTAHRSTAGAGGVDTPTDAAPAAGAAGADSVFNF